MTTKGERITVRYRNRRGMYIISDPERSNIVVIGKLWKGVVFRAEKLLDIIAGGSVATGGVAPLSVRIGFALRHGTRTCPSVGVKFRVRSTRSIGVRTTAKRLSSSMLTTRVRPPRRTGLACIPRMATSGLWTLCARALTRSGMNSACVPTTGTT